MPSRIRRVRAAYAIAAMLAALSTPSAAQHTWVPRVRLDNDAYNFWRGPGRRPDEEYTNGVHLSVHAATRGWLGARFSGAVPACTRELSVADRCLTTERTLGQDVYTPRLDRAPYSAPSWEDERPYFGWLFVREASIRTSPRELRRLELALGVTGEPSGAELAQSLAHAINRRFTRRARGWETQIGFEPGVVAGYTLQRLLVDARAGAQRVLELAPYVSLSAGNILTQARFGATARAGLNLSHPWHLPAWRGRESVELYVLVGAEQSFVARDISLDGNTINRDRRVDRVPAVAEVELGGGLRLWQLRLEYRAVTRGKEYRTGPDRHTYSAMIASLDIER
jgi:lipid A 3-O-deacylase